MKLASRLSPHLAAPAARPTPRYHRRRMATVDIFLVGLALACLTSGALAGLALVRLQRATRAALRAPAPAKRDDAESHAHAHAKRGSGGNGTIAATTPNRGGYRARPRRVIDEARLDLWEATRGPRERHATRSAASARAALQSARRTGPFVAPVARRFGVFVVLCAIVGAAAVTAGVGGPAKTANTVRLGVGIATAFLVFLAIRARSVTRAADALRDAKEHARDGDAEGTLARALVAASLGDPTIAAHANLLLARTECAGAMFKSALERCDAGLERAKNVFRARDSLLAALIAERAYILVALRRTAIADAELEVLATSRLGLDAESAHRIAVLRSVVERDLGRAGALVTARPARAPAREGHAEHEALEALVLATSGALPAEALDRLEHDLAAPADDPRRERLRVWVDAIAPGLRDLVFDLVPSHDADGPPSSVVDALDDADGASQRSVPLR